MNIINRLLGGSAAADVNAVNAVTRRERERFAKTMPGESAAHAAARLGCIAG